MENLELLELELMPFLKGQKQNIGLDCDNIKEPKMVMAIIEDQFSENL
jgi:hypothetical protein